ncbi:RagB/SusD family nutrient uptake outer membrane protein [Carboxylicivirga sp. N1Y90]|uniref:RagB/SusD family nutrient uptake outer membrane protein n=1 Tax=Carboxylicivirga fragile TaxID=3417571 RepID=UPI003D34F4E8|nr:RagB/SusD family nutrient uptake outer membrane protein [Marinilabiliaceae bacterium N1Y90]
MKKILYFLSIISLFACSDDFLERNPESVLSRDNILATKPSCEAALHSIYVKTMFNRVNYYNVSMQEARADILNYRRDGYSEFNLIFDYNQGLADNSASRNSWIACYGIIDACNLIINNELTGLNDPLDPNSEAAKVEKADYEAQARVARAATYLDLLSYYSRPVHETNRDTEHSGVPLVLVNDYDLRPARATTMEVYRQIYEDLMFAAENLIIEHDVIEQEMVSLTFSKAYAHGLLARFYMNLAGPVGSSNTYQLSETVSITAAEALNKAIESCDFVLALVQPVDNFIDLEYGISRKLDETILMSITLDDDMGHNVHAKHWDINNDDAGDILRVSEDVINEFSIADKRLDYFYHPEAWKANGVEGDDLATRLAKSTLDDEGNEMIGAAMYGKFASKDFNVNLRDFFYNPADVEIKYKSGFGDFNIMRASEIALIKAEACARTNQPSLAFDAYALVKQRYFDDALPEGVTLEEIMLEKRLEFIGEGVRMLDLLRLGQNFSRYESSNSVVKNIDFNNTRLILPLPDTDVKNNTNLQQNPGYDN